MAVVQSKLSAEVTGTTGTLAFNSAVTAGNTIVVCVIQGAQAVRTYTATDDIITPTAYTVIAHEAGPIDARVAMLWTGNHPGGTTTVSVTQSSSAQSYYFSIFEISNATSVLDFGQNTDNDTADGNAYSSPSPGLTNAEALTAVAVVNGYYASTSYAAPSGFTRCTGESFTWAASAAGYFASGVSSERGTFVQTGTARATTGILALFGASGGGGSTFVPQVIMVL